MIPPRVNGRFRKCHRPLWPIIGHCGRGLWPRSMAGIVQVADINLARFLHDFFHEQRTVPLPVAAIALVSKQP